MGLGLSYYLQHAANTECNTQQAPAHECQLCINLLLTTDSLHGTGWTGNWQQTADAAWNFV